MKNVWNIFKQDLKNIRRVPLVGLLLLGLAILPALYAWFNLGSAWDPYANTSGIQIGVVNEDAGTEIEGEALNVGDEIVDSLKENDELGWQFLSKQEAEDGVEHGDLYAAIYIEETFSEDLAQVLDGEPKQAEVLYQVNEKVNAIAPKMTSAGASAIVAEMNDQFIEETSSALFEQFDELGIRIEEELPTMRRVKSIVDDLDERFPEIDQFADRLIEVEENWDEIDRNVDQFLAMEDYFPAIHQGAELLFDLEEEFPKINELGDHVLKLEEAIPELEEAVEDLSGVGDHFSEVAEQLESALEKTEAAEETVQQIQETIPALVEKGETAEEYMEAVQLFAEEAEGSADTMSEIIRQQLQFINQAAQMTDEVLSGVDSDEAAEEISEYITKLDEQLTTHIKVIDQTIELYHLLDEEEQNEDVQAMLNEWSGLQGEMESLQEALGTLNNQLEQGDIDLDSIETVRERAQKAVQSSEQVAGFLNSESGKTLGAAYDGLIERLQESDGGLEEAYAKLDSIGEVLEQAEEVADTSGETIEGLLDALPDVEARVNELIEKAETELPQIVAVIETLAEFVEEDLPGIEEHVHTAADAMREDLPEIEEKYEKVAGILEEKVPEVKESVSELNNFSREYLPEFEDIVHDTAEHFNEIEEKDQIQELITVLRNDLDEESEFFASPVHLKEESLFEIPNYGSANAPFYTALSIWVGALLLSNLITTNVHPIDMREDYTLRHIYFGKLILFLIVGMLQGLVVSIGDLLVLGVYAKHPVLFVLFSVLISIVFMTIVYTLASILGNIGKALAIILLVLQLSSSGGTFPIDVAPPFFQAIHPYIPFTYAINLLREAVGGAIPALVWENIFYLLLFMVLAFIVGVILKPLLAKRIEKTYEKSKSSRMVE